MSKPIPQPPETVLIGNAKDVDADHLAESLQRLAKLYGDIYRLTIFGNNLIVLSSQELVNFVCDEEKFDKSITAALLEGRAAVGDGLFTAYTPEPNWKLAHKILMPAFGPTAIRDMFPQMMDIASQLVLRWQRFAGEEFDVCDNFTRLTLDTLALCGFNYRFNSFYHEKLHPFINAMVNVLLENGRRAQRLPIQNALMLKTSQRYYKDIAYMHKLCDEIIKERQEQPVEVNDLLNRMLHGKDPDTGEQLSNENIRYQMITFLTAGHETTSGLLSFTLYFLLKNPEVLHKAQAEVDQFEEITIEILGKLKYIDAILKETLRLQSTAPMFTLGAKEDSVILPGGYEVTKEDNIVVLLSQLHRDPRVWDKPEEFNPERMLNGGYENLPPNAWKPFGNGQRACIGRPFAWQESLLVMALVLKHFHIEFVDPTYDLRIKQTLTIKPDGLKVRVRSRHYIQPTVATHTQQDEKQQEKQKEKSQTKADTKNTRPMTILFGSNAGSCESFAKTLASEAPLYGYNAKVATLDSSVDSMPTDQPVIIVTASYEGKPCENAKQFVSYLESNPKLPINYAVFGAGHRDWASTYQKIPKFIDATLEKCGGKRIFERGEGDASGDFFGSFESWKENLFEVLSKDNKQEPNVVSGEKLSIQIINSPRDLGQINDYGIVIDNKILTNASDAGPEKRFLEIQLPKGQTYRTGDYLAVLATNPIETVYRILKRFNLSADTYLKFSSSSGTFLPTSHPVSAFDILSGYVELTQPVTKKQLEVLANLCDDDEEKDKILKLTGSDAYEKEILSKRISIIDILDLYPSCELSFEKYLRMLPALRVRQYSISSSPLWNAQVVTLTLDVLKSPALSGVGEYHGVASNYLANLKKDDRIPCSVRPSQATFHPPEDPKIPMVMIAAGTGIAPFRGFIQERAAQISCGREVGQTILYYGCRGQEDFLHADELDQWSKLDAVQVKVVFSRQGNPNRKYVQDLIWEDREEFFKLYHANARFYTCGNAKKLGASIQGCFIKIIADHEKCNEEEANKILERLPRDRYSVDVFA